MKKNLFLVLGMLVITSCVKNNGNKDPQNTTIEKNLLATELYTIPVKSGKTTYVVLGNDTIAVATSASEIYVPRSFMSTKSEDIKVTYQDGNDPKAGEYQMWQTIAFEDSKSGDYDYNDLVIHVKYQYRASKLYLGLHPIALGSTKNIALGCRVYKGNTLLADRILANNCREELFNGTKGFINTLNKVTPIHYEKFAKIEEFSEVNNASHLSLVWYIIVDGGTKLFSVNDKFSTLDAKYRPYGIVITNTGNKYWQEVYNSKGGQEVGSNWFEYPMEGVNVEKCYPSFATWLKGGALDMKNPQEGTAFDIDKNRIYELLEKDANL